MAASEHLSAPRVLPRRTPSPWARLAFVVVVTGIAAFAAISLIVWYQQDRPLMEIEAVLAKGQISQAMTLLARFQRTYPDDTRGQLLKARILVEGGQTSEALRLFEQLGAVDVADLRAWAKAHFLRREWSSAQPILERCLELSPNDPDVLHQLTACRSYLGDYVGAFEMAKRLSNQRGQETRGWLQIGALHNNLSNDRSAIEAWDHVLEFDPKAENLQIPAADFFGEFGRVLLNDGQPERARNMLRRSLELKESSQTLATLGQALLQLGETNGAIDCWKQSVRMDPSFSEPREALARNAFHSGQFTEAGDWLKPVLQTSKLTSSAAYLMQQICQALHDDKATADWQRRTDQLRAREKLQSTIRQLRIEAPNSFWGRAVRAYDFAASGNWHEAEILVTTLADGEKTEPFVRDLAKCVRTEGTLPSLELLPVSKF